MCKQAPGSAAMVGDCAAQPTGGGCDVSDTLSLMTLAVHTFTLKMLFY